MERPVLKYQDLSSSFNDPSVAFCKQYCCIYLARLKQMTGLLEEVVEKKWRQKYPVIKLHNLASEVRSGKCIVFGTLFKDQKLKPSILKELSEASGLLPQPIPTSSTDDKDKLYIEDEVQRYEIIGNMRCEKLVTGITCALLGTDDGNGRFLVEDFVFAGPRPQPLGSLMGHSDSVYVLLISGLNLIKRTRELEVNLELLKYWLYGLTGMQSGIDPRAVSRIIIAGGSVCTQRPPVEPSISLLSKQPENPHTFEAVQVLDRFLEKLCAVVDVDLMAGPHDPSNHVLPQKPLHPCLFPRTTPYQSFHPVQNPYYCDLDGVKVLGTSGQTVDDILARSTIEDPLEALGNCLEWGHLAPTAPDTLGVHPFDKTDPFIFKECPHVLFAGNQKKFATGWYDGPNQQRVRLTSIPDFSATGQVALLDLQTFDCTVLSFKYSKKSAF